MSLLNFSNFEVKSPRNLKNLKLVLGISALVGVIALGSTLAASINLNSNNPVEFGQGVAQTTACDSEILITPYSQFENGDPGAFMFSGLMLSQVDTTDQSESSDGCAGKSFLIKLYKENGDLINTSYTISVSNDGTFSSNDGEGSASGEDGTDSSVNLVFGSAEVLASDIYRITIESSELEAISLAGEFPCGTSGYYVVDEVGVLTGQIDCLGSLVINDSVVEIASQAFWHRPGITSIVIPDSVLAIGNEAFNTMPDLVSLDIGDGVTEIGNYLFADSTKLSSVTLGSGITHLRQGAFYNTAISSIVLPPNLISIGADAFNTTQLTCVDIPGTVEFTDPYAFDSDLPPCTIP